MKRYELTSAATTNAASIKAAAGEVRRIVARNTTTSARYVKLYNKSSSPSVGSDVPIFNVNVPAKGTVNILGQGPGLVFSTGIASAVTTNAVHTDSTAVGAGDVILDIQYV